MIGVDNGKVQPGIVPMVNSPQRFVQEIPKLHHAFGHFAGLQGDVQPDQEQPPCGHEVHRDGVDARDLQRKAA